MAPFGSTARIGTADFDLPATCPYRLSATPAVEKQYEALERVFGRYRDRGLTVLGVPCNQFGEQEPGSAEEIATFCSRSYDVSFPLTQKLDVNGPRRHPLYRELTPKEDAAGEAGDV